MSNPDINKKEDEKMDITASIDANEYRFENGNKFIQKNPIPQYQFEHQCKNGEEY